MSGLGRGGRGAALLQALETPIRRPGQPRSNGQSSVQTSNGGKAEGNIVGGPRGPGVGPSQDVASASGRGMSFQSGKTSPPTKAMASMSLTRPSPTGSESASRFSPIDSGVGRSVSQPSQPSGFPGSDSPHSSPPSRSSPQGSSARISPVESQGSDGQRIDLKVNYLAVQCKTKNVYQYAVSYKPEVDSKNMRFHLLKPHVDVIGNTRAFDGVTLFLPTQLPEGMTLKSVRPTDGAEITLRIVLTKVMLHEECHQLYNVIFRRVMRALELTQVGRHYYNPKTPIKIPQHKLELWPGYVTSISRYDGGLMLMCDISHRMLRIDTCLDFMCEIYQTQKHQFRDQVIRLLVGTVVLTRYNNKTYRVDEIAWDKNPQSTFLDHSGQQVSFLDYYKRNYGIDITDKEQPLLISRPKRKAREPGQPAEEQLICLVPELCSMTGLSDAAREDFRVMKDIAEHTRLTPNQRQLSMRRFVENINKTPKAKEELEKWGLSLDPMMMKTHGRVVRREKIHTQTQFFEVNAEADFAREIVNQKMITPVPLTCWSIVFTRRDQNKASDFVNMMTRVGPAMGMEVGHPLTLELKDDRTETYIRSIREHLTAELQMVVVIFPTKRDDRYNAVKKLCCLESPIPSQCINSRTIGDQRKLRSVTQKVALQMNCKLGGELWAVDIPMKNLMVIGIDTYHEQGKRSVGGFVASTNDRVTRWYSRVCFQERGQELIDGLRICFVDALRKYHEINHRLPDRIIVFRDGVGDGQMSTVRDYEVAQLEACFHTVGEDYNPKLGVIVVQKRISTRLFFDSNRLENPPPGTVLDHTVTRVGSYDFFLVSQHVRQGTVTPTHYTVVHDNTRLKPDHVQRLAYKMTHMYYNWPGTVRVPAPCQYAHKVAYLVGESLQNEPSRKLSDRLFYL